MCTSRNLNHGQYLPRITFWWLGYPVVQTPKVCDFETKNSTTPSYRAGHIHDLLPETPPATELEAKHHSDEGPGASAIGTTVVASG